MTLVKVNRPINRSFDGLMNELFNDLPISFGKSTMQEAMHFPPANITEKNDAYLLELSAPGFEKSDFSVSVDNNILLIKAEKKTETTSEADKTIRKEFGYKSFSRSFTLDEKIEEANISARYENGILKLELPKKEEVKKVTKAINIQ